VKLSQFDLAHVSDVAIMREVIALRAAAGGEPPSARRATDRRSLALVRALNERRRLLAVLELDLINDEDAEGSLVEPGTNPVTDALEELRRRLPEWPVQ
jgi:hypothetical protein